MIDDIQYLLNRYIENHNNRKEAEYNVRVWVQSVLMGIGHRDIYMDMGEWDGYNRSRSPDEYKKMIEAVDRMNDYMREEYG